MNDRQIECFLEAGRLLYFTRAAENLLLPQPAVSRYISSLEQELGVKLFLRQSSRKVLLTEEGKAYYNLFLRTSQELAHTRQALSAASPPLRLGVNKSWHMADFMPEVVARCRAREPNFRISYDCLDFMSLTAALKEKRLDAVLSLENYLSSMPEFELARVSSIQRAIVYSDRLPGWEDLKSPSDFYPYDFLIADDPLIRKLVEDGEDSFRAYHFVPRFRTVSNLETVLFYVENGAGVAFLDQWCHALHYPHIRHINLDEYPRVALAWRRHTGVESVELFRDCLCQYFIEAAQA